MATIKRSRWNAKTDTSSAFAHGAGVADSRPATRQGRKHDFSIVANSGWIHESIVHGETIGTGRATLSPWSLMGPRGPRGCDEDASRAKRAERGTHDQRAHRRIAESPELDDRRWPHTPPGSGGKHRYFVNQGTGPRRGAFRIHTVKILSRFMPETIQPMIEREIKMCAWVGIGMFTGNIYTYAGKLIWKLYIHLSIINVNKRS